jgi:hypothetical protein
MCWKWTDLPPFWTADCLLTERSSYMGIPEDQRTPVKHFTILIRAVGLKRLG